MLVEDLVIDKSESEEDEDEPKVEELREEEKPKVGEPTESVELVEHDVEPEIKLKVESKVEVTTDLD